MVFFSSFCSLGKVFLIQESDREGNQSYSNFLEVCKLAGVLTTINKPTTGLLSLPNMDNYTATRASPAPAPDFNSNFTLFSLTVVLLSIYSSLCQSQFAAIFVATFSGKCCSSCSDQIAFCSPAPLTTRAVALTPIAKSECLIPASQEEPPTCNEIFDPSSICLHVPQSALDPGCNGNAFNGC